MRKTIIETKPATGALIVGAICYPLWGWLNAVVPTYPLFLITRAGTGIDDSSYPGPYSLISDYYPPKKRGKIYGFLQVALPAGYPKDAEGTHDRRSRRSGHWRRHTPYLHGVMGDMLRFLHFRGAIHPQGYRGSQGKTLGPGEGVIPDYGVTRIADFREQG